jgi:hypothetical protein
MKNVAIIMSKTKKESVSQIALVAVQMGTVSPLENACVTQATH